MKHEGHLQGRELVSRDPRVDTSFDVLVRYGADEFEARVLNLSGRGFRLRCTRALEPGWEVRLQAGKLVPVKAVIRWVAGEEVGGLFTEPMAL